MLKSLLKLLKYQNRSFPEHQASPGFFYSSFLFSTVFRTESSPKILHSSFNLSCISGMPASWDSKRCFSSVNESRVAVSSCSNRQPPSPSNCSRCVWYFLWMVIWRNPIYSLWMYNAFHALFFCYIPSRTTIANKFPTIPLKLMFFQVFYL